MRRKHAEERDAPEDAGARITPADVQQVEFRLAFRGYNERDVDAFLDRITEDLASYVDENERLRSATGTSPAPVGRVSVGDGQDARAEAEAILARARDEASAIVRSAEQQAAAVRAGGGASSGDARAAVAPFLNAERDFLQSLGSLVQGHAEEIKQMVHALRARVEPSAGSHAQADADTAAGEPASGVAGAASAAEIRERLGVSGTPAEAEPAETGASNDEPVVIESATEPAYSSEGTPASESRERSLRELFWGED